jgi:hypothetical protein
MYALNQDNFSAKSRFRSQKQSLRKFLRRYVARPNAPCFAVISSPFHLQRRFDLSVINIQDSGQERWKRKYVYWIPALHIDGKEVAKGRWDADTVVRALDEWEKSNPVDSCEIETKEAEGKSSPS